MPGKNASKPIRKARDGGIANIRTRVKKALPEWWEWPRSLRQLYMMLEVFGASEQGIKEFCQEFERDHEELKKVISGHPSFGARLEEYRAEGRYAKVENWLAALSQEQLRIVYQDSDENVQYLHLSRLKAGGKGADFALQQTGQKNITAIIDPAGMRETVFHHTDREEDGREVPEESGLTRWMAPTAEEIGEEGDIMDANEDEDVA